MPAHRESDRQQQYLPRAELGQLLSELQKEGFTVVAPTLVAGVVLLRPIQSVADLPQGVRDHQDPGRYRTSTAEDELYFQFASGPDSPKRWLFPPEQTLFSLHVDGDRFVVDAGPPDPPRLAFFGLRPCDVAAMAAQDRVFGAHDPGTFRCESNPYYSQAKQNAFLVVVNCTSPGATCFCASMGTGPTAKSGYDLALTELRGGFVIQAGSLKGEAMLRRLPVREATPAELELAELRLEQAAERLKREADTEGLARMLDEVIEHPHWDSVAKRCLGCGNCTMVCPTCFCASIVDSNELGGKSATRVRRWESCFTHQFSYTTAGPVRSTIKARFRHWLRHKHSTWQEQFGTSGCVGCGRCITWCPAGIDITQEIAAIRADYAPAASAGSTPAKGGAQ